MTIIKDGDIVTGKELRKIIDEFGGEFIMCAKGHWAEEYETADDISLEDGESFRVNINYGHNVQFVGADTDTGSDLIVTTGLMGKPCYHDGWIAEYEC